MVAHMSETPQWYVVIKIKSATKELKGQWRLFGLVTSFLYFFPGYVCTLQWSNYGIIYEGAGKYGEQ